MTNRSVNPHTSNNPNTSSSSASPSIATGARSRARGTSRRTFLAGAGATGAALLGTGVANALGSQAGSVAGSAGSTGSAGVAGSSGAIGSLGLQRSRPVITHGVATGDVRPDGGLVWARVDRPARMVVEASTDPTFPRHKTKTFRGAMLTPDSDGTGRLRLVGMQPGQKIHYRVIMEDQHTAVRSQPVTGSFTTAPSTNQARKSIRLHWSGDVAGQGYGINPDIGGMFCWKTMADRNPDLFIHSGDTVYADGPIEANHKMDDGRIFKNFTSPFKNKVAETLEEFRGQHAYNLMDENYKRFNSQVAQLVQWDDHETTNNWYPGEILEDDKYQVKDVNLLAQRGFQAFHEWQPLDRKMAVDGRVYRKISYGSLLDIFVLDMRSYKDRNPDSGASATKPGHILGAKQEKWLVDGVKNSTATWKIIANDLPLGIVVPDGDDQEGVSNGTGGKAVGREAEIGRVLRGIKDVRNVVWLTADVHYTAAHHYSPDRADFQDFAPFWEFVSGPLNAGGFGPNKMDGTFGPEVVYVHAPAKDKQNSSPLDDFQHFGEVDIDGGSKDLTVRLFTTRGKELWSKTLRAQ